MLSVLRKILGVIFIILGLLALVTPFTPGSWLALIGLELLGMGFLIPRKVRTALQKIKDKIRVWFSGKKVIADPTPIGPDQPTS